LTLSVVYAPPVLIFGSGLAELLFGAQYRINGTTLCLLAAIPLVTAISGVSGAVLRALEQPDRVLWTYVAAAAVTCLVGLPLVNRYSVNGALGSILLSTSTIAILGTWASRRFTAQRPQRLKQLRRRPKYPKKSASSEAHRTDPREGRFLFIPSPDGA
jgi:O-antigen/teichoic acid export membrane protein